MKKKVRKKRKRKQTVKNTEKFIKVGCKFGRIIK